MARSTRSWVVGTLALIAAVLVAAALWASSDPDGLERVAEDLGFIDQGQDPGFQLLPDYTIPGLEGPASTILAGLLGALVVLILMYGLGKLLARRSRTSARP